MSVAIRKLLEPGRIGSLELRNRILMAPMGSNLAEADGSISERQLDYYEARARGGAGMLVVGVASVAWPRGQAIPNQVAISDDRYIPGLRRLSDRAHRHGAAIAVQLQHAGKVATQDIGRGEPLLVPSLPAGKPQGRIGDLTDDEIARLTANLSTPQSRLVFREATEEDIAEVTRRFAEAAVRAREAGFDGVEIHAGHGYLLASFLSPASNRRTDRYGGSRENRARFLCEVLRAIRARVGDDYPVWCRIDAREFRIPGGITLDDACATARLAEAAGADAIHVSAYGDPMSGVAFTEGPLVHRPAGYLGFAARVRRETSVPVIAVGRLSPEAAEMALREEQADFVAMARPLLADPDLPRRLGEPEGGAVRPCVYCYTCVSQIFLNDPVRCAVQPSTAFEREYRAERAARARRVVAVGGGPAGMEAARVAAERGHRVTLLETAPHLGGSLWIAAIMHPPYEDLLEYYQAELGRLGVTVRTGVRADAASVARLQPDAVVVAAGGREGVPPLPGIDGRRVLTGRRLRQLLTGTSEGGTKGEPGAILVRAARALGFLQSPRQVRELSRVWMPIGRRVVIVGGNLVGLELAGFLRERGREVTVLERGACPAPEMALPRRWRTIHELREAGVVVRTETTVKRIEGQGRCVVAESAVGEERFEADHVVVAAGVEPDPGVVEAYRSVCATVSAAGDCAAAGHLEGAIRTGAQAGLAV